MDASTRDELLDRLQARVAHLEAAERRRKHRPGRLLPIVLVALLVALIPLAGFAAGFTDLPDPDEGHNADIIAIQTAGITKGCNPPANDQYCPHDLVTRQDMASFLARLGGLGTNPPVANAASLGGQPASAYLRRGAADLAVDNHGSAGGPLPKSISFTSHGGLVLLSLSGSAYGTAIGFIGVNVTLDGTNVASLIVAVNDTSMHHALVPVLTPVAIPAGQHSVTFTAITDGGYHTGTDTYDIFYLTTLELPITTP
jgi:hypothetical protein